MDAVTATVAVWALDKNTNVAADCSLPPDSGSNQWIQCYGPYFDNPSGNVRLRLEVYNKGPYNMDVDTAILEWDPNSPQSCNGCSVANFPPACRPAFPLSERPRT